MGFPGYDYWHITGSFIYNNAHNQHEIDEKLDQTLKY